MGYAAPIINVPKFVENEVAYVAAARARIAANAAKGARARWFAAVEDASRLHDWLVQSGEFTGTYVPDEDGYERLQADPRTLGMFAGGFGSVLLDLRDTMLEHGHLTVRQTQVVRDALARAEQRIIDAAARREAARARDSVSEFVGEIGERRDWTLTIRKVISFDGEFGTVYINLMNDAQGNVIVGKGTKSYGVAGQTINVKATIVKHDTREGVKQTMINRPKF